ncbi:gamma-glutamyltransferase, partial [Escherichia coli]|nr:gamma-glutamyltransferase [Escherichia coli]
EEFAGWFETFGINGKSPKIGEVWSSSDHADTLIEIAETEAESFYRGRIAEKIDAFSKAHGGFIRKEDLAAFQPEWVKP